MVVHAMFGMRNRKVNMECKMVQVFSLNPSSELEDKRRFGLSARLTGFHIHISDMGSKSLSNQSIRSMSRHRRIRLHLAPISGSSQHKKYDHMCAAFESLHFVGTVEMLEHLKAISYITMDSFDKKIIRISFNPISLVDQSDRLNRKSAEKACISTSII